jgi:hypothetical protein
MAKVTEQIASIIMGLSATHSIRQIQTILDSQGIKLSSATIGNLVKSNRDERAGMTKEVVTEHIKKTVTTDLEILEDMRNQLNDLRNSPDLKVGQKLMCIDRLNKVIDTRLKFSGAGDPDKDDDLGGLTDEELEAELRELGG